MILCATRLSIYPDLLGGRKEMESQQRPGHSEGPVGKHDALS